MNRPRNEILPGQRWHRPVGCNSAEHPGARSVRIVAIIRDDRANDTLIITAQWFKHKRYWHYETEPLALFEWGVAQGHWGRGSLPKGPKGGNDG